MPSFAAQVIAFSLNTVCMIDIFTQTACLWFWQAWRGEPSCGLMLWTILTSVGPRHTKISNNPEQDGKGMSLGVIPLDTATRCKLFACIVCPTHLLKLVGGLLDLPQASQKVQQHQAMMLCESKHVTVKVRKTETEGNTFLTPHGVSPRLELFCFSNEARALDLMIKPSWSLRSHRLWWITPWCQRASLQGQGHSVVGCSFGQLGQGNELLKLLWDVQLDQRWTGYFFDTCTYYIALYSSVFNKSTKINMNQQTLHKHTTTNPLYLAFRPEKA